MVALSVGNESVAAVVGAVIPILLTEVAVATPKIGVTSVGVEARTAEPVPVTALTVVPLIWKTFPVAAVLKVLFVKASVVALPIKVSVAAGSVSTPDAVAVASSSVVPEVEPP